MLLPVLRTCLLTAPMGEGWRQRCALAAGQLVGGECWGGASTGTPTRGRKRQCLLLHVSYPGQSVKSKTPWGHQRFRQGDSREEAVKYGHPLEHVEAFSPLILRREGQSLRHEAAKRLPGLRDVPRE